MCGLEEIAQDFWVLVPSLVKGRLYLPVKVVMWIRSEGIYSSPWIKGRASPSSVGKEPACNTGDPGSIPESGRSAREGIGYPLQYSWASLVAKLVKNPPAMWETWIRSLGWEDPLQKGKATHSGILACKIPNKCSMRSIYYYDNLF